MRTQGEGHPEKAQGPELYVLDSVDGVSSIEELSMMLAMSEDDVINILARLKDLQLVQWDEPAATHEDETEEGVGPKDAGPDAAPTPMLVPDISATERRDVDDGTIETFRFEIGRASCRERVNNSRRRTLRD